MRSIEDIKVPNSTVRTLIREMSPDIHVQRGVEELLARCAAVCTSFIACMANEMRRDGGETDLTHAHIAKVFEGIGLFDLANKMARSCEM